MNQLPQKYLNIEEEFFELDSEQNTALVRMEYEKPSDIIETSAATKTPRMSTGFLEEVIDKFDYLPMKYKLHFRVAFDDMDGYSEEQMKDICNKNLLLETKTRNRIARGHNRLALYLCLIGIVCILLSIWVNNIWTEENTLREIVVYVLDIAATVPFWAAMEIYFIDNSERRRKLVNLRKRFDGIEFRQKQAE
jgi:hypothetical protein